MAVGSDFGRQRLCGALPVEGIHTTGGPITSRGPGLGAA